MTSIALYAAAHNVERIQQKQTSSIYEGDLKRNAHVGNTA